MKLCVFPNDPMIAYYNKGELKDRYFNPKNLFDEIHLISFIEHDIDELKVQKVAGNAKLKIHSFGKLTYFNRNSRKKQVLSLLKTIKPNVIRAYNSRLEGWIAANCCKKLQIPFYVSIHVQYDGVLEHAKKNNYKKYIGLKLSQKFIEPFTLKNADKITIVYKIIEPYVKRMCGKYPEVLYNRVDLSRFYKAKKIFEYDVPVILTVGRLTPQKNPDLIIHAIKNLNVKLILIGDGELYDSLLKLVSDLGISDKVIFKKSIPNNEIQDYFKSADVFVLAYEPEIEGLPIPVLEAMATGLPIIIPYPLKGLSDGLEDSVLFANLDAKSYKKALEKIISNKTFSDSLTERALEKSQHFDGKNMEEREAKIYHELLNE